MASDAQVIGRSVVGIDVGIITSTKAKFSHTRWDGRGTS